MFPLVSLKSSFVVCFRQLFPRRTTGGKAYRPKADFLVHLPPHKGDLECNKRVRHPRENVFLNVRIFSISKTNEQETPTTPYRNKSILTTHNKNFRARRAQTKTAICNTFASAHAQNRSSNHGASGHRGGPDSQPPTSARATPHPNFLPCARTSE